MKMRHRVLLLPALTAALVLSTAFAGCDLSALLATPFSNTSWTFAHNNSWLDFDDTTWTWNERNMPGQLDTAKYSFKGTYTCTGQTATMTATQCHKVGSGGAWESWTGGWIATIGEDGKTLAIQNEPPGTKQ